MINMGITHLWNRRNLGRHGNILTIFILRTILHTQTHMSSYFGNLGSQECSVWLGWLLKVLKMNHWDVGNEKKNRANIFPLVFRETIYDILRNKMQCFFKKILSLLRILYILSDFYISSVPSIDTLESTDCCSFGDSEYCCVMHRGELAWLNGGVGSVAAQIDTLSLFHCNLNIMAG